MNHPRARLNSLEAPAEQGRRFDFFRDTFTFRNNLVWEYTFDPQTGSATTRRNTDPDSNYSHRCFVVARSVRQFFYHARFEPEQPPCTVKEFRQRIRAVVSRSPRIPSEEPNRIPFPGFDCLRQFSSAHETLLKENCGGAWQSYFLRSHWRMIFPITRKHQEREAERLRKGIESGKIPILHVVRFPQLTINHALLAFGTRETAEGQEIAIYDPNLPEAPTILYFHRATRTFEMPANIYWGGGALNVYETYKGWFY